MTDMEFRQVAELMLLLWPESMKKKNPEQLKTYQRVCGRHSVDRCRTALRGLAERAKFMPGPPDLSKELKRIDDSAVVEHVIDRGAIRRQLEAARLEDRELVDRHLADLLPGDAEEHKTQAMADDWRLRWMVLMPVTSNAWKSIIVNRVRAGLLPTQPWQDQIDEAEAARNKNGEAVLA